MFNNYNFKLVKADKMKLKSQFLSIVIFILSVISCNIYAESGPIAWYSFDDSDNLGKDFSGNELNGTNYGAQYQADGVIGGCSYYAGSGQYISVSDDDRLNSTNLTIAFWLKASEIWSPRIMGKRDNSLADGWSASMDNGTKEGISASVIYSYGNGGHLNLNNIGKSNWVHTSLVFTPNTCAIYLNGELAAFTNWPQECQLISDEPFTMGGYTAWGWAWLKGWLDEVKIWDRVLSAKEIAKEAGLSENDPIAWYSFDDSDNLGKDFSGNELNGTNYGAQYQADGVIGGCSYYAGSGQYISVPDDDALDLTNLTVTFWLKTPTDGYPSGQNRILGKWDNREYGWFGHLYPYNGVYSAMAYGSGNSEHVIPVKNVGRTEWVHVTMAMTPYSCELYTNGVLGISTNFTTEALLASDVPLTIGGFNSWGWAWLKGWLDEVKIWDRMLSAEEIAKEAGYTNSGKGDSCLYFTMRETTDDLYDIYSIGVESVSQPEMVFTNNHAAPENWIWHPNVSIDDRYILYNKNKVGDPYGWEIWAFDKKSDTKKQLLTGAFQLDWHPTGDRFLYAISAFSDEKLREAFVTVTNGNLEIVTTRSIFEGNVDRSNGSLGATYSPDGNSAAFVYLVDGAWYSNAEIAVGSLTGALPLTESTLTRITSNSDCDSMPQWTLDGQYLLWMRGNEMWKSDSSGGGTESLVMSASTGAGGAYAPFTSPPKGYKGSYIAALYDKIVDDILLVYPNGNYDTLDIGNNDLVGSLNWCLTSKSASNQCNLIAYYPFNGNANDESGNGNDGTVNGATLTTDRFGNPNSAYSFDGQNDYIRADDFDFSRTNISVIVWLQCDASTVGRENIIGKGNNESNIELLMKREPDGKYDAEWTIGGKFYDLSGPVNDSIGLIEPSFDSFDMLVLTYNGQEISFYMNGVLITNRLATGEIIDNSFPLTIGTGYDISKGPIKGTIDEISIYDCVLAASEIQKLYDIKSNSCNLIAYYPFNGNANDESGNGHDGTVNGATLTTDIEGNPDSAYSFDGNGDYIEVLHSSDLSPTNQITFSTWAYREDWSTYSQEKILSKTHAGGYSIGADSYDIPIGNIGVQVFRNNSYASPYISASSLASGWHHFAGTYDGRYLKFYVDGELKNSDDAGNNYPVQYNYNSSLIIASEADESVGEQQWYFDGKIDEVKIWNCALSAEEIAKEAGINNFNTNGTPVTSFVLGGVTVTVSTASTRNFTLRTYNDSDSHAFGGLNNDVNAPAYPENVSGIRFIATSDTSSSAGNFPYVAPITFEFSSPVCEFGLTTLDLLEECVKAGQSVSLEAYDASDILLDLQTRTGEQGLSGLDLDWLVSSTANISKVILTGTLTEPNCNAFGIDDIVLATDNNTVSQYIETFEDSSAKTNGVDWYEITADAPWSGRHGHNCVEFNGKIWLLGGLSSSVYNNEIWSSSDGTNWNLEGNADWSKRGYHATAVFDNKLWLFGGNNPGSGTLNDVWSSSDGVNWTLVTSAAPWSTRCGSKSFVYNNKLWVVGGVYKVNNEFLDDVWSSVDGSNWTQVTSAAPWGERGYHESFVFKGKMWIMGGVCKNWIDYSKDVWSSIDGTNWTLVTNDASCAERHYTSAAVYNDKIWICGSYHAGEQNDVWSSPDGANWTLEAEHADWPDRCAQSVFVYDNELWIAGGEGRYDKQLNDVWCTAPYLPVTTGEYALTFDGVDDVVTISNEEDFDFNTSNAFSLEAWVKTTPKNSGDQFVIAKQNIPTSVNGYYMVLKDGSQDQLAFYLQNSGSTYIKVLGSTDVIDGEWHHVAAVYDGSGDASGVKLYVDGKKENTFVAKNNLGPQGILNDAPLTIGTRTDNSSNVDFNGEIDEARVWNVALTENQICANIDKHLVGNETGLSGYWRFDEGLGQTAYDSSSNGNNGRLGSTENVDSKDPEWKLTTWPHGSCDLTPIVKIITTPTSVTYDVATFAIAGSNNINVVGGMTVSNTATQTAAVFDSASGWTAPALSLNVGENRIFVTGTNVYGESSIDNVVITRGTAGTGNPVVEITTEPTFVTYDITEFAVAGSNNINVIGGMTVSNTATQTAAVFDSASGWTAPALALSVGANKIFVTGTNVYGETSIDNVVITRGAAGTGKPFVDITTENAIVTYDIDAYLIAGTNNANVIGGMSWYNTLTKEEGIFAASSSWSIADIALDFGDNIITVCGTNLYGDFTNDTVRIRKKYKLSILTTGLPNGFIKAAYSAVLEAEKGTLPYVWDILSGKLPAGIALDPNGSLTGEPTVTGLFNFVVRATDKVGGTGIASLGILINSSENESPRITTTELPDAPVGVEYFVAIKAVNGTLPYEWSIVDGFLPSGLQLRSSHGIISGTPTAKTNAFFIIKVTDKNGASSVMPLVIRAKSEGDQTLTINEISRAKFMINWRKHGKGKDDVDKVYLRMLFDVPEGLALQEDTPLTVFFGAYPIDGFEAFVTKNGRSAIYREGNLTDKDFPIVKMVVRIKRIKGKNIGYLYAVAKRADLWGEFGVINETLKDDELTVPIQLLIDTYEGSTTIEMQYESRENRKGKAVYPPLPK